MEDLSKSLQPYKDTVGAVASVVTILQFFSGVLICKDISRRKSTVGISAMPFVGGIVVGVLMLKFSLMMEDKNMFNVNVAAIVLNAIYLIFYLTYTSTIVEEVGKPMVKGCALIASLFYYINWENPDLIEYRYSLIVTVLMLLLMGSPLLETKEIIKSKDASSIPFPLTFMGFIVSALWLLYGVILMNYFMVIQNFLGLLLCMSQLFLCYKYPGSKSKKVE